MTINLRIDDETGRLIAEAIREAGQTAVKYPQPNYLVAKLAEESGETIKAAIHFAEGRDTANHVRREMVQTIATVIRLFREGDRTINCPSIMLNATAKLDNDGD